MAVSEPRRESEAKMIKNKNGLTYLVLALLCVWAPLFMGAWDKDKPASSTSLRSSNPEILANQSALETAISNEHEFSTGGTNSGDHTQGSARSFSQATAPATQIDGGAFASTDLGLLWVDTDDNAFYMLTATTPTWTPVSTEVIATLLASNRIFAGTLKSTGDFTVGANKVVVTAATGNTAIAGTLGVTGVATVAKGSLLASSDAPTTDAMIANKKYIDDQVAAALPDEDAFGTWTNTDSESNDFTSGSGYQAGSDGFVIVEGATIVVGETPVGTVKTRNVDAISAGRAGICMPVKSGDTWEVTTSGTGGSPEIWWLPIGTGTSVKQ